MKRVLLGSKKVTISSLVGKGGEGEVYAIAERPGEAVKIYKDSLRAKRENKVRAMVQAALSNKTALVAYPSDIVSDLNGQFLGFVMKLVSGYRPLHELYSPKSRRSVFPEANYKFVVHAAINVARAVGKVHQTGCVIGDLNHSGVLVGQDATVALIDADSFQFMANGTLYGCVVGVPDFTPPELHGRSLSSVTRTIEHDNFGLAVALFHLLFMGRHPYAGLYKGPDISIGEAIAQNRFAFSELRSAETRTQPPPRTLTLKMFPREVASAFERAFGLNPQQRPTASEWNDTLLKLEKSLRPCRTSKTHFSPVSSGNCIWCKLAEASNFDMFPDLTFGGTIGTVDVRKTEDAIREILAFKFPAIDDILPNFQKPKSISRSLQDQKGFKPNRLAVGACLFIGAIAGFVNIPELFWLWIILGFSALNLFSRQKPDVGPFLRKFEEADERIQDNLDALIRRSGLIEAVKVRADMDAMIAAYKQHDQKLAEALKNLKLTREDRQRTAFLDRFSIRRARVAGIGPAKTATLISFGIETAADVNIRAILRIPGFGRITANNLLAWRRKHEAHFRYSSAPDPQDIQDERNLRSKFAAEKAKLDNDIRNGLGTLRNSKARLAVLPKQTQSESGLIQALIDRAQAELDLKSLGASIPVSKVKFTIPKPVTKPTKPTRPTVNTNSTRVTSRPVASNTATPDCPSCGRKMVLRTAKRGRNPGKKFWGCSGYPSCKGTRNF